MSKLKIKLNDALKEKKWEDFLAKSLGNSLLEKAQELPDYFRTYASAELIAVIPALGHEDANSNTYYSAPSLDTVLNKRLAPAFLFDSSKLIENYGDKLFELDSNKIPNYCNRDFTINNEALFLFDSESSCLHNYHKKGYIPSALIEDMKNHIKDNPFAVIFKGCDDGHVGIRFASRQEANRFLSNLEVFDNIFDNQDYKMQETLLKMKKENPNENVSSLFKGRLEYHN